MKITILGSGTSQGVPVIACKCKVCLSDAPKDKRLRASILIEINNKTLIIDTGPDFRQQMLTNHINDLDAVLFTHEHKDHVAGLDDIKAFNFLQKKPMEVYCSNRVKEQLNREFHYFFAEKKYPGAPSINLNLIDNNPFILFESIEIIPIEVLHYKLPVFGFRINDFTYITDAKTITEKERKKIIGTKILIINCLRIQQHISHFNLDEALNFIKFIKPQKAYLTHISHLFGTHNEIEKMLPENVLVAYDSLQITC
ncbi:MAG: MBL fold metallo-hydrolase [Crocinitomicaceae bacterium]|nr:MBL fold metallo-hydrolase [Crocinitomicaceae bacterium]